MNFFSLASPLIRVMLKHCFAIYDTNRLFIHHIPVDINQINVISQLNSSLSPHQYKDKVEIVLMCLFIYTYNEYNFAACIWLLLFVPSLSFGHEKAMVALYF